MKQKTDNTTHNAIEDILKAIDSIEEKHNVDIDFNIQGIEKR